MGRTVGASSRYTFRLLSVLLALLLLAAACGDSDGGDSEAEADEAASGTTESVEAAETTAAPDESAETTEAAPAEGEPVPGGTITIAVDLETAGWDPPNGLIGFPGRMVNHLVYGQLTMAQPDGTFVPYLAESVESNDDATVWTITLRDGMTFHDGTPFDAEALKFHFDRMAAPESSLAASFVNWASVEVLDALTVQITLTEPNARVPEGLADSAGNVVSPAAVEELGAEFNNMPVGAGPYRFVEWVRDDHLTLEKNEDFIFDDRGWADTIIFRPLPDDAARAAALRAGDVDAIVTTNTADIASFRDEAGFELHEVPFGASGMLFNIEAVPDTRVRQAVAMAVDKEAIADLVFSGVGEPTDSPWPMDSPWYADVAYPEFDPEGAAALIEEIQQETGAPVSLEIMPGVTETAQNLAVALQAQLQDVGMEVTLAEVADNNDYVVRYLEGNYEMTPSGLFGMVDPAFEYTRRFDSEALLNGTGYKTPEMDAALDIGISSLDQAERKVAYDEAQRLLAENLVQLYLATGVYGVVLSEDIDGYGKATNLDGSPSLGNYFTPILADTIWRADGGS